MPDEVPILGRPLYKRAAPSQLDAAAHAGLWYDKFCNVWQGPRWTDCKVEAPKKLNWINTVTRQPVGNKALLSEYAERRRGMISALGGRCTDLVTESRFVTGLGREHPVENGFVWHPTLGTPYLPGSSVKGIVRAWARQAPGKAAAGECERILGEKDHAGRVILLDALPLEPVRLEADVMTPHYVDYYQSSNPAVDPPGDWTSPVPIPFLVVASGGRFQFGLIPRAPEDAAHLDAVQVWLCNALEWLGGGAKTAVGYGRFTPQGEATPAPSAGPSKRPRYQAGARVPAKRVEDPKGKGRLWFEADDGFGGTLIGPRPATSVEMGHTISLEIAARLEAGYNFCLPREKKEDSVRRRRGKR